MTHVQQRSNADRRRVLFLTHRVPFPPDKGDRIRSWQLLKRLSRDYDVWLGCVADEPWTEGTERTLRELCADVRIAPLNYRRWWNGIANLVTGRPITTGLFYSPELKAWIEQVSGLSGFDAVVVFCSNMASYTRLSAIRNVPKLIDLVDVDSAKWSEYARRAVWPRSLLYRTEAGRLQQTEKELGQQCQAVALTTSAELEIYRTFAPDAASFVVGNGVATDVFQRPATQPLCGSELVFVGAMDYKPNVEGVTWFCQHVWPQVRRNAPAAVLRIVGRRPTAAVRALASLPGVHVHADVPDVRPYLLGARLAVVPLQVARGVQNKVLEALACETPVVASPSALTGLDLVVGEDALAASSPDEWVDAISRLLRDESACLRLAKAGRKYVERHCQWDQRLEPLDSVLCEMIEAGSATKRDGVVPTMASAL